MAMYDQQFQRKVVKLTAINVKFATQFAPILSPEYFDYKPLRILFEHIFEQVITYEREFDEESIMVLIHNYAEGKGYGDDIYDTLRTEAKEIFKCHIPNEQFVTDQLIKFVKKQRLKNAILKSVDIMEQSEDYEKVLSLIDEAVSTGYGVDEGSTIEDLFSLPGEYRKHYDRSNLIQTGITEFDNALKGGMGKGEVHIIQGRPKGGKSSFSAYIGSNVLRQNKTVFHITLEIKQIDVLAKYSCNLANIHYDEMFTITDEEYNEKIGRYNDKKHNLFVKYWTAKTINCMTIRSWITRIRSKTGISPDLIIIDYDDYLLPINKSKKDDEDMYGDAGAVYDNMIYLADYFKCPVLTMAQPKREAWNLMENNELIHSFHLAHSALKAHKAYSISSINFREDSDTGILFADYLRRGVSTKIGIKKDLSKSMFYEKLNGTFVNCNS